MIFPKNCPVCKTPSLVYDQSGAHCPRCNIYNKRLNYLQHVVLWAHNQTGWWWRCLIALWFAYMLVKYIGQNDYAVQRTANPFNAFDLGIHELGHFVFMGFGEFMTILGGSLFQCLFPLMWLAVCIWKRWHFAACMVLVWFSYNLFDVASYAADARARLFPLATFSSDYDSAHDWYQILSRLHHLEADEAIAHVLRVIGTICGLVGLILGGVLLVIMFSAWVRKNYSKNKSAAAS